MGTEYKLYDVYDLDINDYLIERATMTEISDLIGVGTPYIRQCISRKFKIKRRYLVTLSKSIQESNPHKGVIGE